MEAIKTKILYKLALDNSVDKCEMMTDFTKSVFNAVLQLKILELISH